MAATKGLFSVIQFCPDLERQECANVGVVLAVPGQGFLRVRMSPDNEGPKKRFGAEAYDDGRLDSAKHALEGRILAEGKTWRTADDLAIFGKREGNNLLLGPARTILAEDPAAEIEELYQRLVHVEAKTRRRTSKPDLDQLFESRLLTLAVPLLKDYRVTIPDLLDFVAPWAYHNGGLKLISPEAFPVGERAALEKMRELAVNGHLIHKHPPQNVAHQQLIVVGRFDPSASPALKRQVSATLREHESRLVPEEALDEFVEEVRQDAHA